MEKGRVVEIKNFTKSVMELNVYQRAYSLSLKIHNASLQFPKTEQYALADQIRRASKSICANLAEGYVKQSYSKPEFRRYISSAVGSAGEMQTWVCYCHDLGYIQKETMNSWFYEYDAILAMLIKLRGSIK